MTIKNESKGTTSQDTPIFATVLTSYGTEAQHVRFDEATASPTTGEATPLVVPENSVKKVDLGLAPTYRDVPFALLFLVQVGIMIWLGVAVAPRGFEKLSFNATDIEDDMRKSDDITEEDLRQFEELASDVVEYAKVYPARILLYLVVPCALLAFIFAYFTTAFVMKPFVKPLVYSCLIGSLVWTAVVMLSASIASNQPFVYLLTAVMLGAVGYYISFAWRMVPFAAVNLKGALEGISRNCGMYVVACVFAELGFCWVLFWLYVVVGVSGYQNNECRRTHPNVDPETLDDICGPPFVVVLLFFLSLYWTSTALMNTIQVTVAGVMATWCFDKDDADGCCSSAVMSSMYRSLTYSFGSICFGSLLQALISVLRFVVESARNQRDRDDECGGCGALFLCILECLAKLLEDIIDYFNQWAYVFVGIYGYSYLESGRRVMELFRARGWTSIITNDLVGYVLGFITFTMGIITGAAGLIVEYFATQSLGDSNSEFESYLFGPVQGWRYFTFGIGFLIGIWVSSVVMNVVKGAVNALIVCWADSPSILENNHPALTQEMAESWRSVFPEAVVHLRPAYSAVIV